MINASHSGHYNYFYLPMDLKVIILIIQIYIDLVQRRLRFCQLRRSNIHSWILPRVPEPRVELNHFRLQEHQGQQASICQHIRQSRPTCAPLRQKHYEKDCKSLRAILFRKTISNLCSLMRLKLNLPLTEWSRKSLITTRKWMVQVS